MKQINICGNKNSGKTTLISKLIPELRAFGLKVGTIKHTSHDHEFDVPNTDSWIHQQAGSEATIIVSPGKIVTHRTKKPDEDISTRFEFYFQGFDLVLCEGDRFTDCDIIECRSKDSDSISFENGKVAAVFSDFKISGHPNSFLRGSEVQLAKWIFEEYFPKRSQ